MILKYPMFGLILLLALTADVPADSSDSEALTPLRVRRLLEKIEETSPAIQELNARLEEARLERTRARVVIRPTAFYSRQSLETGGAAEVEQTFGVSQDISFLWSRSSRLAAANASLSAAEFELLDRKSELQIKILVGLRRLHLIDLEKALIDSISARFDFLLRSVQARSKAGEMSPFNAERFRLELVELRNLRQGIADQERESIITLIALTGLPEQELRNIDVSQSRNYEAIEPDSLIRLALEANWRVAGLREREKSAQRNLTAVSRAALPGLELGIGRKVVNGNENGIILDAAISFELLGTRQGEIALSQSAYRAATSERLSFEKQLVTEVRIIATQLNRLIFESKRERESHSASGQTLTLASRLYLEGELTATELVDVFRASIEALQAENQLLITKQELILQLRRLTGRDFSIH